MLPIAVVSRHLYRPRLVAVPIIGRRSLSFTFAGPRKLEDLIKKELMDDKAGTEVADIWFTYHEEKVRTSLIPASIARLARRAVLLLAR